MKKLAIAMLLAAASVAALAATPATVDSEPQFTADGQLLMPAGCREWPLVGTGLGMARAKGTLRQPPAQF